MSRQFNSTLVADMARLGEPSSTEENNRLYSLVATGDADARRQMTEGNMPLVVAKVNAYLIEHPNLAYLRDDLTSAGFLALVQAVGKMQGRRIKNPTSYLSTRINGSLSDLVEEESPIRVRRQSKWQARAKGKEIGVPLVTNRMPDLCRPPFAPQEENIEARDLVRSCCRNKVERRILRLCERGHSFEQVGEYVGLSHITVRRISKRILARYDEKRNQRRESA